MILGRPCLCQPDAATLHKVGTQIQITIIIIIVIITIIIIIIVIFIIFIIRVIVYTIIIGCLGRLVFVKQLGVGKPVYWCPSPLLQYCPLRFFLATISPAILPVTLFSCHYFPGNVARFQLKMVSEFEDSVVDEENQEFGPNGEKGPASQIDFCEQLA